MSAPKVTVLMPVYNGERFLREAVESILNQTFSDFEFIIINDGSSDHSVEIITSYNDSRINLVHNEKNLGLIATLNKGIDLAKGEYIARMDCDDVSLSERLEKQVSFLAAHPEVGVSGTWCKSIGEGKVKVFRYPDTKEEVRCSLLFDSPIAHPSVIMRRDAIVTYGLYYNSEYPHSEDYELWARASEFFELAVQKEILLFYRIHSAQVTKNYNEQQVLNAGRVRVSLLKRMGLVPSDLEFAIHQAISMPSVPYDKFSFIEADDWFCKIAEANRAKKIFPEPAFSRILLERLLTFANKQQIGIRWVSNILTSRFLLQGHVGVRNLFAFLAKRVMQSIGRD